MENKDTSILQNHYNILAMQGDQVSPGIFRPQHTQCLMRVRGTMQDGAVDGI